MIDVAVHEDEPELEGEGEVEETPETVVPFNLEPGSQHFLSLHRERLAELDGMMHDLAQEIASERTRLKVQEQLLDRLRADMYFVVLRQIDNAGKPVYTNDEQRKQALVVACYNSPDIDSATDSYTHIAEGLANLQAVYDSCEREHKDLLASLRYGTAFLSVETQTVNIMRRDQD